jgi:hypothetical protein
MNTDKVLALAREAGLAVTISSSESLHKFAALLLREMEAENAELRKDAERYRWLRLADNTGPRTMQMQYHHVEHLDAAIDQARSANDT